MRKQKNHYVGSLFELDDAPKKPVTTKSAIIYTDGACSPNPGCGGWAAVILEGERKRNVTGGDKETTNNRMELLAAINGLLALAEPYRIKLFTDSNYVREGVTNWLARWERKGWKTKSKNSVKNQDLWQELSRLNKIHNIEWHWVKGHNGDQYNEECNQLAQTEAVRRKLPASSLA